MKNIIRSGVLLLGVLSLAVFNSCTEDLVKSDFDYNPNKAVTLASLHFDSLVKITDEAIKLQATLLDTGESKIYDQGFIYSTSEAFATYSAVSVEFTDTLADGSIVFEMEEFKLAQGKDFYFKAFVLTKDGMSISEAVKTINLPVTWETIGSVNLTDKTFTDETYSVDLQKFKGRNEYRLVDPFQSGDDQYLSFFLDDDANALQSQFKPGAQNVGADGMVFYWHPSYVGSYCVFTNKANVYTIGFLLLEGSSLYLGGEIIFEWVDGYPGEIPEVIDYNKMAVEPIVGAVSEFTSAAFYNKSWAQVLSKAIDIKEDKLDSPYKNLYYFSDLYAERFGLAFYYNGDTVIIPGNQKTGAKYRDKDLYVSPCEDHKSFVKTYPNGVSIYTFGLEFHLEDGTSVGDFVETFTYSKDPITYEAADFFGSYLMTGSSQFGSSNPDAAMPVTIAAGATADTFLITGIDYVTSVKAHFDAATSVMSIAPQTLPDYVGTSATFDMTWFNTTPEGDVSDEAAMSFTKTLSGDLVLSSTSAADGYILNSVAAGGYVDGYYGVAFTPQAQPAGAKLMKVKSTKTPSFGVKGDLFRSSIRFAEGDFAVKPFEKSFRQVTIAPIR